MMETATIDQVKSKDSQKKPLYKNKKHKEASKKKYNKQIQNYKPGNYINPESKEEEIYTVKSIKNINLKHPVDIKSPACAPYNFVPLNDIVVYSEKIPDFNKYHGDRYTGFINIEIKAKSPLYIRGTLKKEQLLDDKEKNKETYDFFSPGGIKRIPGSSLRGMIRTIVEISSFGKFGFIDDKYLYFRDVAGPIKNEYKDKTETCKLPHSNNDNNDELFKAGLLQCLDKAGIKYRIYKQVANKIPKSQSKKKIADSGSNKKYDFFNFYKVNEGIIVVPGPKPQNEGQGNDWLIKPFKDCENDDYEELSMDDIESYKNDVNRFKDNKHINEKKYAYNLLKSAKTEKIPCFYVKWIDSKGKMRISIGHTKNFRIPYDYSIKEHLPDVHDKRYKFTKERIKWMEESGIDSEIINKLEKIKQEEDIDEHIFENEINKILEKVDGKEEIKKIIIKHSRLFDISEAIFGNQDIFASRVFFEDAIIKNDTGSIGPYNPKILSSPKPTSFQHYLVQKHGAKNKLSSYNSNAGIRGNKLYWHKSGKYWKESDLQKINKKVYTKIKPVNKESVFEGRIRFENLSKVELGALLFCLDLPKGCYHKLGMAKSLGLGSIKITPDLKLSKRKERYKTLNFEVNQLKSDNNDNKKISNYKNAFEHYVLKKISESDLDSLWDTQRLLELKLLLNYEFGLKLEESNKTRYMDIDNNEFKKRPVLPASVQIFHDHAKANNQYFSNLYISKIEITNIRCFKHLKINFQESDGQIMMSLLLGNNSSGKTTLLRSIALGLCNESDSTFLLKTIKGQFVRDEHKEGKIEITLNDPFNDSFYYKIFTTIHKNNGEEIVRKNFNADTILLWPKIFVCGYGVQRCNAEDKTYDKYTPKAALRSLFDSKMPLQNPNLVLLQQKPEIRKKLQEDIIKILMFDNSDHKFDLSSNLLEIKTNWGKLPYDVLGDGYSSTIQWTLDFFNWAIYASKDQDDNLNYLDKGGILLIDELDQHLHPKWQRYIVQRLRKQFPKIQIIAATHNPLCAAGITDIDHSQLISLQENGSNSIVNKPIDKTLLKGKRADQVLALAFDMITSRTPGSEDNISRYTELFGKTNRSEKEENELQKIKAYLDKTILWGENEYEQTVEKAIHDVILDYEQKIPQELLDIETKRQLKDLFS